MGKRTIDLSVRVTAARRRLRERTLPALTTALVLQISLASGRRSYDLRALSSAFGLMVLLALALVGAAVDALVTAALAGAREAARIRVRFGPAAPVLVAAPLPITDDLLLDKRGRPLRGAARTKRIASIERERALLRPVFVAPAVRVLELPARLDPRALRIPRLPVPSIPVRSLPVRWVRIVAITTTMTFVFATALGTTGFITRQGSVALGASTTLSIISGEVDVRASEGDDFRPVSDGALLRAGMTIRAGADTYAVLTYFEGSTVSIDPGTTLVIEALESNPDGSTIIAMRQEIGRTWHSVTKLLNQGSKYEVRTPTATATVRGTMFAVGVKTDQRGELVSTVETTEGAVATAKAPTAADPQPQEVLVQPGFQVTVKQSAPIEQPKPAPEPERRVTVTVGANAGLVLDPLGRANGVKDGKVIVQTPGATVSTVNGQLVVTMPNIPDGKISTVVDQSSAPQAPVEVVTTVSERGQTDQSAQERVEAPAATNAGPSVSTVELKKGEAAQVTRSTDEEKKDIAASVKVAEAPKVGQLVERREERKDEERKEEKKDGPSGPGAGGFIPQLTVPPLPVPAGDQTTKRQEPAKTQPKQEAPKNEAPKTEPPKQEAPKQEAPKQEAPRSEPPKQDAPKQEAPKNEPPKQDAPKQEAPKQEAPKNEPPKEKGQAAPGSASGFVPQLSLPPLPFSTEDPGRNKGSSTQAAGDGASGNKEEGSPKEQQKLEIKFELPKIEIPFFQSQPTPAPTPQPDRGGSSSGNTNERGRSGR